VRVLITNAEVEGAFGRVPGANVVMERSGHALCRLAGAPPPLLATCWHGLC
jgi:hypothetical protein